MLIAVGTNAEKLVNQGTVITSNDGLIWNDRTYPFNERGPIMGVANYNGITSIVNDNGHAASSVDLINWEQQRILDGNVSPRAVEIGPTTKSTPIFMMVGIYKFINGAGGYLPMDEAGVIFRNTTGSSEDWELFYSHYPANSRFNGIRQFKIDNIDTWFAMGAENTTAIVLYSQDDGTTWNKIILPQITDIHTAYDAVSTNDRIWITVNNRVLSASVSSILTNTPDWDSSQTINSQYGSGDLVKIATNPYGHIVAVSSGGIFYTTDRTSWKLVDQPGYRPRSIIWYDNKWIAGADSDLHRYTYWTSTDTITWMPNNNQVFMYNIASTN